MFRLPRQSSSGIGDIVQITISLQQQFLAEEVRHTMFCAACDFFRLLFSIKQLLGSK